MVSPDGVALKTPSSGIIFAFLAPSPCYPVGLSSLTPSFCPKPNTFSASQAHVLTSAFISNPLSIGNRSDEIAAISVAMSTLLFTGRPRFGSVTVPGWNGSGGSSFRFRRFLCKKGFSLFQYSLTGKDGSGFGSWKTVLAVPVPLSVSGKTVPMVPVPGSASVPEPPCFNRFRGGSAAILQIALRSCGPDSLLPPCCCARYFPPRRTRQASNYGEVGPSSEVQHVSN